MVGTLGICEDLMENDVKDSTAIHFEKSHLERIFNCLGLMSHGQVAASRVSQARNTQPFCRLFS